MSLGPSSWFWVLSVERLGSLSKAWPSKSLKKFIWREVVLLLRVVVVICIARDDDGAMIDEGAKGWNADPGITVSESINRTADCFIVIVVVVVF